MGSKTNRSLAAKNIKARDARIVAGGKLADQFNSMVTRSYSKAVLRSVADMLPTDMVCRNDATPAPVDAPEWKVYNPSIKRAPLPLAMRCMVDFEPVLIKRG